MREFGMVTEPNTVRLERVFPGPIERIWAYLTEPEKRRVWLAAGPMADHVGGVVELRFRHSELSHETTPERFGENGKEFRNVGEVTACDPPHLLSFTWPSSGGDMSEVTFELSPQDGDVLMVLTHRRLADRPEMTSVASGWHTHLGILEDQLSGRKPRGFWSTFAQLEKEYEKRLSS